MSLLIKGMDMPESCRHCRYCIAEETDDDYSPYYCVNNPYLRWSTSVDIPDYVSLGCKVSEIPTPHGDLIDRDKLIQLFLPIMEFPEDERIMYVDMFIRALKNAPTIIEAEE